MVAGRPRDALEERSSNPGVANARPCKTDMREDLLTVPLDTAAGCRFKFDHAGALGTAVERSAGRAISRPLGSVRRGERQPAPYRQRGAGGCYRLGLAVSAMWAGG